eukprot:976847-Amphidinium_carterae.1
MRSSSTYSIAAPCVNDASASSPDMYIYCLLFKVNKERKISTKTRDPICSGRGNLSAIASLQALPCWHKQTSHAAGLQGGTHKMSSDKKLCIPPASVYGILGWQMSKTHDKNHLTNCEIRSGNNTLL